MGRDIDWIIHKWLPHPASHSNFISNLLVNLVICSTNRSNVTNKMMSCGFCYKLLINANSNNKLNDYSNHPKIITPLQKMRQPLLEIPLLKPNQKKTVEKQPIVYLSKNKPT